MKLKLGHYANPNYRSAILQLINSVGPYVILWALMFWVQQFSIVFSLLLAIPTGLFLVRIFILQHDCGHLSFVPGKVGNDRIGFLLGILTFTPILNWRYGHNMHHATSGNLDRRDHGDVWTLTKKEYEDSTWQKKLKYRIYRNPFVLFLAGPGLFFLLRRRFPIDLPAHLKKERKNVYWTDLWILLVYGALAIGFGWKSLLLIIFPVAAVGSSVGVWLFYVQHQYENAYWVKSSEWSHVDAGFEGSSYYDLPKWLNWFTADIAIHHIHHVESRIPNYELRRCLKENPELESKNKIGFRQSLHLMNLKLWDEVGQKLVGFDS